MEELIKKQDEYIKLLCDELDEIASIASVHHWKSGRVEQGEKLRQEIKELKQKTLIKQ